MRNFWADRQARADKLALAIQQRFRELVSKEVNEFIRSATFSAALADELEVSREEEIVVDMAELEMLPDFEG